MILLPSPPEVSPLDGVGFRPVEVANPEGVGVGLSSTCVCSVAVIRGVIPRYRGKLRGGIKRD
ncbi:MAG: hypothetical protein HC903_21765 [Methylacidiphilales bacterium]|nr:hypothetical protein [Candidatus Methylacidiphilales bacterium]NJR14447.1 hypothetical protein [Calothrix sp. CSU_2_0]